MLKSCLPSTTRTLCVFVLRLVGTTAMAMALAAAGVYGWFTEQGAAYFGFLLVFIFAEL